MKLLHVAAGGAALLLLISSAAAQPPPPGPPGSNDDDLYGYGNNINPSVGVIIIVLVAALFLLGFFSMYVRHCSGADRSGSDPTRRLSAAAQATARGPRGLDSAVVESFPTFDYAAVKSLKLGKGALECAVCLNEFEDDETLRLIPKCDHVFHSECVDPWLAAHTTCPVCRADLTPLSGDSDNPTPLPQISEAHQAQDNDAVAIDVSGQSNGPEAQCETESMEQPLNAALPPPVPRLNRNRTRWFGRFSRSNSTGHLAVKQWESMERFTLRLPEEVRRQLISGKLQRSTSLVALPRESSSRRGYRTGEGSSRGRSMLGSLRVDRSSRSERWFFSLTPPFFSRAPSVRSPKVAAAGGGSVRSSRLGDSVHASSATEGNLPPV